MVRLRRRDYINLAILILFFLAVILFLTRFKFIYGSTEDWQNQHWIIPEYFRNLFYKNHDILPSFAFNLGGGQNIYNFSYYGLFSPVILLSYFFPFVSMMDYIIITSITAVIVSVVLFYIWLNNNKYATNICFLVSFIFLCASPLIFQSHKHIMFMNYIPFLLLGLIGIDNFIKNKKTFILIIASFLMIMTSYFFSVGGIFVLFIYSIYKQLKIEPKISIKLLFFNTLRLVIPIMISVFMSAILLLPTISAIINGRNGFNDGDKVFNLSNLFPDIVLENILYSPYSLGLTSLVIIAIISGFTSKKKERMFLSTLVSALLLFPVFLYILNGTLYINSKVLIPFVPLFCMIIANFIDDLFKTRTFKKRIFIVFAVISLIGIFNFQFEYFIAYFVIMVDAISICLAIIFFCKKGNRLFVYVSVITMCVACVIMVNLNDKLLLVSDAQKIFSKNNDNLINSISNEDKSFYRFSNEMYTLSTVNKIYSTNYYQTTLYSSINNKRYNKFYFDIFNNEINYRNSVVTNATKNILFDTLMSNKYLITTNPPIGYDFVKSNGVAKIYKNENVLPIGYATNNLMSESFFDNLEYPYSDEALLNYVVVNRKVENHFKTNIKMIYPEISSVECKNAKYTEENGNYSVSADINSNMILNLKEPIKNKVVLIRFTMDLKSMKKDTFIRINDVKNKLTCMNWKYRNNNFIFDYVLSSNEPIDKLNIQFQKGEYKVSNFLVYALDYDYVKNIKNSIDPFEIDMNKTHGDVISGKINVKNDGYFILSIPYDKGFNIKVDNKIVNYEIANKTFIGFAINKGSHNIEIKYKSPMRNIGIILSLIGAFFAICILFLEKLKSRNHKKN